MATSGTCGAFQDTARNTVPSEYTDLDYRATPIGDALRHGAGGEAPHELRARLLDATGFAPSSRRASTGG